MPLLSLLTAVRLRPLYFALFPRRIDCEPRHGADQPTPAEALVHGPVVIEPVYPWLDRVWYGPGPKHYYDRWSAAYWRHHAAKQAATFRARSA